MIISSQVGLKIKMNGKNIKQQVGLQPGLADVTNIPSNPIKGFSPPFLCLKIYFWPPISHNLYQLTPPCTSPPSSSTPWSGRSPLQACTMKNFGFPIKFGQFLGRRGHLIKSGLFDPCTCCWRIRRYTPCWSTGHLLHRQLRLFRGCTKSFWTIYSL